MLTSSIGRWLSLFVGPAAALWTATTGPVARPASPAQAVAFGADAGPPTRPLTLWYRRPATQWVEALPIGNGRLGGMIFGDVVHERIQLNEDTLWAGGPYAPENPDALAALPLVRQLIFSGQYKEAHQLVAERMLANRRPPAHVCRDAAGRALSPRARSGRRRRPHRLHVGRRDVRARDLLEPGRAGPCRQADGEHARTHLAHGRDEDRTERHHCERGIGHARHARRER
ncbi:MAG: hypothetical protein DMF86_16935 [Acidobacteria bacterium]|nr:MAG: hypothetical protein DMF86_16935 [Acidobacteriota bacterium]